jgi:hypothetical protein
MELIDELHASDRYPAAMQASSTVQSSRLATSLTLPSHCGSSEQGTFGAVLSSDDYGWRVERLGAVIRYGVGWKQAGEGSWRVWCCTDSGWQNADSGRERWRCVGRRAGDPRAGTRLTGCGRTSRSLVTAGWARRRARDFFFSYRTTEGGRSGSPGLAAGGRGLHARAAGLGLSPWQNLVARDAQRAPGSRLGG